MWTFWRKETTLAPGGIQIPDCQNCSVVTKPTALSGFIDCWMQTLSKSPVERQRRKLEDNIKVDLNCLKQITVDYINVVLDRLQWSVFMNIVTINRIQQNTMYKGKESAVSHSSSCTLNDTFYDTYSTRL